MEKDTYNDPNFVPDIFDVAGHTIAFNDETALGEQAAWIYLSDKTSIEITQESYELDVPFFSVRRHCSDEDFENGAYHKTCGVMETAVGDHMDDVIDILTDMLKPLEKQKIIISDSLTAV